MSTESESSNTSNRSGGADLNAQGDINVGSDVAGRDKATTFIFGPNASNVNFGVGSDVVGRDIIKVPDPGNIVVKQVNNYGTVIQQTDLSAPRRTTIRERLRQLLRRAGTALAQPKAPASADAARDMNQIALQSDSTTPDYVDFRLDSLRGEEHSSLELTPQILAERVIPYLIAIADVQAVIDVMHGRPARQVTVRSISVGSIDVSMGGAAEALLHVEAIIVPWQMAHAKQLADLAVLEKLAEIRKKEAEARLLEAQTAKTVEEANAIAAEVTYKLQQAEELRLKNEKLNQELQRDQLYTAFVRQIDPNLSPEEQAARVAQLRGPLDAITTSSLRLQVVNISGGTYINSGQDVNVGGDVVGRDKVAANNPHA